MSDDTGTPLIITVDASAETRKSAFAGSDGIEVAITVTLPTWEGSDGPSLDGPDWATQVGDLTMIVAGAAGATVQMIRDAAVIDTRLAKLAASVAELREETATLDSTVDAAHLRLDAVNAPDIAEIERQRKDPQAAWKRAHGYRDPRIRDTVTPPPRVDAVLVVHEDSGNTAWLTGEEAERRVEAGILEPAP